MDLNLHSEQLQPCPATRNTSVLIVGAGTPPWFSILLVVYVLGSHHQTQQQCTPFPTPLNSNSKECKEDLVVDAELLWEFESSLI